MMSALEFIPLGAVLSGLIAAFALFYGSIGVPWDMQTWKAQSAAEHAWQHRQLVLKWVGLPAAVISAACQIAATFWPAT